MCCAFCSSLSQKNVLLKKGVVIKGMHRVGGWDHKGVIVSPYASTHQVLIQHHGVLGFVHPRVSNINHTTSTPKGVTVAPFFLTVY